MKSAADLLKCATRDATGAAILQALSRKPDGPLIVGLCGAQGSGKSTLAAALSLWLDAQGIPTATLSLDDLYRTRAERDLLATEIHPLLRTRGVPGTHDVALGLSVFEALDGGRACRLPRFDKARDDRAPVETWPLAVAETRILLFEGWCVGARAQPAAALVAPINALEQREDRDGRWRCFVNAELGDAYQRLFARIDLLIMLAAPAFGVVLDWRIEQERTLRARAPCAPGVMDDAAVARFVQHYERITCAIMAEMPARANLVVVLDAAREPKNIIARD